MWVFTPQAFISAVAHRGRPGMLMVRARLAGDLERFFNDDGGPIAVTETPYADYRFRCMVSAERFTAALARNAAAIDYPNFKNAVADHRRHDAYLEVWAAMYRAQDQEVGRRR